MIPDNGCVKYFSIIYIYIIFHPIQSYSNFSPKKTPDPKRGEFSPRPRPGLGVPSTSPAAAASVAAHVVPFWQRPWSRGTSPRGPKGETMAWHNPG